MMNPSLGRETFLADLFPRLQAALAARYTIERELGRGGMATVYLAQDGKHHRRVAIKVLAPDLAAALGPERFLREIEILAQLAHPHVLPLHDSGEADGVLYYVMPYVEGGSLRDRLQREKRLPVEDALEVTSEVADGLSYAHARGVVHRDVKPENILFQAGHALISDFGIARALRVTDGEWLTQRGLTLGTPAYVSPEQAAGESVVDARSDLYSLACVLYEMLVGEPPFVGPTAMAVIGRRFTAPAPLVTVRRPDAPPGVAQALATALAADPSDRFENIAVFAEAIRHAPTFGASVRAQEATGSSIAVLPFTNLSPDPENAYFSDGVTEEIITALAHLPGLQVAARSSSFALREKGLELAEIAAKLRVATVLEGSVRRAGNRVRISAQLVDVANGYQLWSECYDRELGDIFAIQDAIARTIARRLELTLTSRQSGTLVPPPTESLEAYQRYLKGRYFSNQRGAGIAKALACYQQAVALDERFAQAHAGVAAACTLLAFYGFRPSSDVMPQAKAAAERALALDETIAEAHASIGLIHWLYDWDWAAADRELKRAIALNPRYTDARHWYAALCASNLRLDEAVAEDRRAVELEPLSVFANLQLGMALLMAGHTAPAMAQLRTALELDPHFGLAHWLLGCAHALEARYPDALPELQAAVDLSHRLPSMVASLAAGYAEAGRPDEARRLLAELRRRADREFIPPGSVAVVYAALGETEEALLWLERAYEARDVSLPFLRDRLDTAAAFGMPPSLRRDPRYHALLRKVGIMWGGTGAG